MKKLGIVLAAFALTLSLAACGSGGGSSAADPVKLGEAMLSEARADMIRAPWSALSPLLCIVVTILVFNILGDALRDVLDPKLKT